MRAVDSQNNLIYRVPLLDKRIEVVVETSL